MTPVRARIVRLLRPEYPEPITEDHYRLAMKVRIGVLAFLAAMNIIGVFAIPPAGGEYDLHLYQLFLVANLPGLWSAGDQHRLWRTDRLFVARAGPAARGVVAIDDIDGSCP